MHNFKLLAKVYGQWPSIRNRNSVDGNYYPIPWYTYPAIEFLSHLDLRSFSLFEYGSGNSTLWWSKYVKKLVAIEDDKDWHKKIKDSLSVDINNYNNVTYYFEENSSDYVLKANNNFDIFIVDGNYRMQCLEHLVSLNYIIKKNNQPTKKIIAAIIILDNSDWYPEGVRFLQDKLKWMQIDFHGFGPVNNYTSTTTFFINPARYHELVYKKPLRSLGVESIDIIAEGNHRYKLVVPIEPS